MNYGVCRITRPTADEVPVLLSVPHCGTAFPPELTNQFKPALRNAPDDTDWFVDQLYAFADSLGITMLAATYSRWVVDLNRHPQSQPLYTDGRIITGLCPHTDFFGNSIYVDERTSIEASEVQRRVDAYYTPYHSSLTAELQHLHRQFGTVLLWDCHSIRQLVPTIHPEKFPDMILGDADGTSAGSELIETALQSLRSGPFRVSHNVPFKGGYITRAYGNPKQHIHALQLEMSKVLYMNDDERTYNATRAASVQQVLRNTLGLLIEKLRA